MASNFYEALDPLDLEILERARDGALVTLKEDEAQADLDSDDVLKPIYGKNSSSPRTDIREVYTR